MPPNRVANDNKNKRVLWAGYGERKYKMPHLKYSRMKYSTE
jgi:hypothetical protein